MTRNPTQQLILDAVITCLEKYGVEKITTRKIAKEAGTNIASINYYFRSKDDLIAEALGVTLQHMEEDLIAIVQDKEKSFEDLLREWMLYLLEGAQRYPRVFMAHMYAPLVEKRFDTPGPQSFRKMVSLLSDRAALAFPQKSKEKIETGLVDVISAVLFQILAPGFFGQLQIKSPVELAERYTEMFKLVV